MQVNKMKGTMLSLVLGVALCFMLFPGLTQAQPSLVFAVHPFKKPDQLKKMFNPLIEYLQKETGAAIEFRSGKDYAAVESAMVSGEAHISYMGPSLYAATKANHPGAVQALGVIRKKGITTFKGVIVAKDGSAINSVADLKGKKFAFGDRHSTLSAYMPAYMLMQAGVFESLDYKFIGSHDNVAKGVLAGAFDAGGIKPEVAANYVGKGLKIVAESDPVENHVLVISSKVDKEMITKMQAAVRKLNDPAVLQAIAKSADAFVEPNDAGYDKLLQIMKQVDVKIPL